MANRRPVRVFWSFVGLVLSVCFMLCTLRGTQKVHAAGTTGGTGPYTLTVTTCGGANDGTKSPVWFSIQAGGKLANIVLDNPGDLVAGAVDSYSFTWPQSLGDPDEIQAFRFDILGSDVWRMCGAELKFNKQQLWSWKSTDKTNAARTHLLPHPSTGSIALSRDEAQAPASWVLFSEKQVELEKDFLSKSYRYSDGVGFITCSDKGSATNDATVVTLTHDGLVDMTLFPAGTLDQEWSQYAITSAPPRKLTSISVKVLGSDKLCIKAFDAERYTVGGVDPEGVWHKGYDAGLWVNPNFGPLAIGAEFPACSKCQSYYFGFALDVDDRVAACAADTNPPDDDCNGVDEDCDGTPDDNFVQTATACGTGVCARTGKRQCSNGKIKDTCTPGPTTGDDSDCDGLDDNCSGKVDENYSPVATSCGLGACLRTGTTSCVSGKVSDSCKPAAPSTELCDTIDNDCDGVLNDNIPNQTAACTFNGCSYSVSQSCLSSTWAPTCAGAPTSSWIVNCATGTCGDQDVCRVDAGGNCTSDADCDKGLVCLGTCRPPSCDDGVQSGTETGVDCGGLCAPCSGRQCDSTCRVGEPATPAAADLVNFAAGTFSRASTATFRDSSGKLETARRDELRWLRVGGSSLALFEGPSTNVLKSSEALDRLQDWIPADIVPAVITANAESAPDGKMTAERITSPNGPARGPAQSGSLTSGTWTLSMHARSAAQDTEFLPEARLAVTGGVLDSKTWLLSQNWSRFDMRLAALVTTPISFGVSQFGGWPTPDAEELPPIPFTAWGFQLENQAFPTSYIPANVAANSRAADSLLISSGQAPKWFFSGTWQVDVMPLFASSEARTGARYTLFSTNEANRISLVRSTSDEDAQLEVFYNGSTYLSPSLRWDRGDVLTLTFDVPKASLTIDGAEKGSGTYAIANLAFAEGGIKVGSFRTGGDEAYAAIGQPRRVSGPTEPCKASLACSCGDGKADPGEACDPGLTTLCTRECTVGSPQRCEQDGDCPNGQNCLAGVAAQFRLPATWLVCAPPICPGTSGPACGSMNAPCGACQCSPQCTTKKCGDDPSDSCGGNCTGFCQLNQAGCNDDADCKSNQFCWKGQAWRFDPSAPAGANVCADLICDDNDPRRIDCGSPSSPCGLCDPVLLGACLLGPLCEPPNDKACPAGQHKNKHFACIPDDDVPVIDDVQATGLGALPGSFSVSDGGTAHYDIPISVPPGRGGLAPQLGLSYDSGRGNSMLGLGWGLDGLSEIKLCPKTIAQDGYAQNSAGLCLNGARLVPVAYDAEDDKTEWRTEIDSFTRIVSRGDFYTPGGNTSAQLAEFMAFTKGGLTMRFGTAVEGTLDLDNKNDARLDTTRAIYLDNKRIIHSLAWAVTEVRDRAGNQVKFAYSKLGRTVRGAHEETELLPRWIGYNFANISDTSAVNEITFEYEGEGEKVSSSCTDPEDTSCGGFRPDPLRGYVLGTLQEYSRRLSTVTVVAQGQAVRAYGIKYKTANNHHSTVDKITECAQDRSGQTCRPATSFGYEPFARGEEVTFKSTVSSKSKKYVLDWNGDGRDDIAEWSNDRDEDGYGHLKIHVAIPGDVPTLKKQADYKITWEDGRAPFRLHLADLDGDHSDEILVELAVDELPDLESAVIWPQLVVLSNESGPHRLLLSVLENGQTKHYFPGGQTPGAASFELVDLNGDGQKDVLGCSGNNDRFQVFLNNGAGFDLGREVLNSSGRCEDIHAIADSSGRESIVSQACKDNGPTCTHALITQTRPGEFASLTINDFPSGNREIYPADVNGDGLIDLILLDEKGTVTWLFNRGSMRVLDNNVGVDGLFLRGGSQALVGQDDGNGRTYLRGFTVLDDDGDGRMDLSWLSYPNGANQGLAPVVAHARAGFSDAWTSTPQFFYQPGEDVQLDIDGDGTKDLPSFYVNKATRGLSVTSGLLNTVTTPNSGQGKPSKVSISYAAGLAPDTYSVADNCDLLERKNGAHCLLGLSHPVVEHYWRETYAQVPGTKPIVTQTSGAHYHYRNAKVARDGRSLGFGARTTENEGMDGVKYSSTTDVYEATPYDLKQTGPFLAHDPSIVTANPSYSYILYPGLGTPAASQTDIYISGNDLTRDGAASTLSRTEVVERYPQVWTSDRGLPFFAMQSVKSSVSENNLLIDQTVQTLNYDRYGNVRWSQTTRPLEAGRVTSTSTFYHYQVATPADPDNTDTAYSVVNKWQVGLPSYVVKTSTDGAGLKFATTTRYQFDDAGLLSVVTENFDALGDERIVTITHGDAWKNVTAVTIDAGKRFGSDANPVPSRMWSFFYDEVGVNVETIQNPELHVETYKRSFGDGLVRSFIDANSLETRWAYDGLGHLISEESVSAGIKTTYTYRYSQNNFDTQETNGEIEVVAVTTNKNDPASFTTSRSFDPDGRIVQAYGYGFGKDDRVGEEYLYDSLGRLVSASRPHLLGDKSQGAMSFAYDELGRAIKTTAADTNIVSEVLYASSATVKSEYASSRGDARWYTQVKDPNKKVKTWASDARGDVIEAREAYNTTTHYSYGPESFLTKVTDTVGNETTYEPDSLGRIHVMHDPDSGMHEYNYSSFGELHTHRQNDGGLETYYVDNLGRPTNIDFGLYAISYAWDEYRDAGAGAVRKHFGSLMHSSTENGGSPIHSEEYYYEGRAGSLSKVSRSVHVGQRGVDVETKDVLFEQDPWLRTGKITYPGTLGLVAKYNYDDRGFLRSVTNAKNEPFWELTDLKQGYSSTTKLGGSMVTTATVKPLTGRLDELKTTVGKTTVLDYVTTFDNNGNLSTLRKKHDLSEKDPAVYIYDELERLKTVTRGTSGPVIESFDYTLTGNIRQKGDLAKYVYGNSDQADDAKPQSIPHFVRHVLDANKKSLMDLTPDSRGRVASRSGSLVPGGSQTFDYNASNQLTRVTGADGQTTVFEYGPGGDRVLRVDAEAMTTYFGPLYEHRIEEVTETETYRVMVGGQAVAEIEQVDGGTADTRYLHRNHLGSVEAVTSPDGTLLESRSYSAFGEMTSNTATDPKTQLSFTGHRAESDLGLVDMIGRFYDPKLGRFITPDPFVPNPSLGQSFNRYSYVRNNPGSLIDPSGFEEKNPNTGGGSGNSGSGSSSGGGSPSYGSTKQENTQIKKQCEARGGTFVAGTPLGACIESSGNGSPTVANQGSWVTVTNAQQHTVAAPPDVALRGAPVAGIPSPLGGSGGSSPQYDAMGNPTTPMTDDEKLALGVSLATPVGVLCVMSGACAAATAAVGNAWMNFGIQAGALFPGLIVAKDLITSWAAGETGTLLPTGLCFTAGTLVATSTGPVPIENLRVGHRVLTSGETQSFDTMVNPEGWRLVRLEMPNPDGSDDVLEIELLRQLDWLEKNAATAGAEIAFALPEMGLEGPALVVGIEPIPPIQAEPGRVVLATVTHLNGEVLELRFEGTATVLEPTATHRLFSADRGDWVAAGKLKAGEQLATSSGLVRLLSIRPKSGVHRVYNIEVETEHSFFASNLEVLSHNENPCAAAVGEAVKIEIALGKDIAGAGLKALAQQTGASWYRYWARDGVTRRSVTNGFGRALHQAVKRADRIHFSLDGIDDPAAAVIAGARGFFNGNMTNAELHYIANSASALAKTIFYRAGEIVASPF